MRERARERARATERERKRERVSERVRERASERARARQGDSIHGLLLPRDVDVSFLNVTVKVT